MDIKLKILLTLAILMIGLLFLTDIVKAEKPTVKIPNNTGTNWLPPGYYRCEIKQEATPYRPAKSYGYIGVFGRYSDGSIKCFIPNNKPKNTKKNTNNGQGNGGEGDNCKYVNICENKCTNQEICTEEKCETKNTNCITYETKTECKEECHKEKEWKKTCTCKNGKTYCNYGWVWETVCTQECKETTTNTCIEWNTETKCTPKTCEDKQTCKQECKEEKQCNKK